MAEEEDKTPPAKDDDDQLGDGGKKALDAERRANRENKAKITALEEQVATLIKQTSKKEDGKTGNDDGKLTDELAQVRAELAEERLTRLRLEVGSEKGLTPKQARRLSGKNRDELEADAEELLETFPAPPPPAKDGEGEEDETGGNSTSTQQRRPAENLKGGGKAEETPEETDPRKLAEAMPRI